MNFNNVAELAAPSSCCRLLDGASVRSGRAAALLFVLFGLLLAWPQPGHARNYTWSPTGVPNSGGAGAWDATSLSWFDVTAGNTFTMNGALRLERVILGMTSFGSSQSHS